MNVLVIPTWYPSGEDKLMGIYHKEFTEALNNNGVNANILFIERNRLVKPLSYLFKKKKLILNETNYKTYIYRMLNIGSISYNLQLKRYVRTLKKAFKNYLKSNPKPDIIHAHVTVPAGYAACILGKKYNIPVVVTEHCGDLERFYSKEPFKQYGLFVLNNSYYTTVSKYMKDIALKYTANCDIIPNLVDTKPFINDQRREIKDTFNLVMVCALREGKRIDIALEAIKKLHIPVHLDIIGDGFYEVIYKNKCRDLGLENVKFLGRKTKKEIADILKREHALLITSELESFAISGIEAMASGLPVITTDCLGPTEYVDNKVGLICKVNDPDDIAIAISTLYDNYSNYDKEYIVNKALEYDSTNVIQKTINIYNKVLENKKEN